MYKEEDVPETAYGLLHPAYNSFASASGRDRDRGSQGPEASWKMLGQGAFTSGWNVSMEAALFLSHR